MPKRKPATAVAEYPEHEKLKALDGRNQVIGEFVEWLGEQGYEIVVLEEEHAPFGEDDERYGPHEIFCSECDEQMFFASREGVPRRPADWVAKYFDIDSKKLDEEKEAMLEECRRRNA